MKKKALSDAHQYFLSVHLFFVSLFAGRRSVDTALWSPAAPHSAGPTGIGPGFVND